jgi:hypothetical protein
MNTIRLVSSALVLALYVAGTACGAQTITQVKPEVQPVEVIGEVVDAWCYASRSVGIGRGAEHRKCATTCILGGVSAGIVDDKGNLYIAAKSRAYQGANHMLLPYVAKKVWVKGWLSKAGGSQLLKIDEVKEWKPGFKRPIPKVPEATASQTKNTVRELLEASRRTKTQFQKPDDCCKKK